jgi:hypothetical protein
MKKKVEGLIIKLVSKFWTSSNKKRIEGESCLQVLLDYGKKKNELLIYELKDIYNIDNILNKEQSELFNSESAGSSP